MRSARTRRAGRRSIPRRSVAFPLNDWPGPSPIKDDEASAREQFGYDAAYQVMTEIVASAGDEAACSACSRRPTSGTTAYPGEAAPEQAALTENDWRRFLDLTEQLGGATGVASLLQTWALTEDEAELLPARADAREAYEALASVADGWARAGRRAARDGRLAVRRGRRGDRGRDGRRGAARPGRGAGGGAGPRAADRRRGRLRGGGRRERDPRRRGRAGVGRGVAPDAGDGRRRPWPRRGTG